ncbi:hypothetical protein LF1_31890 [Rubripirellula obstinata]|uniref:Uncharacterized protein n=1 Tax=Rubripirellula obstinata TaxID=406547 RepID=A0A5B1CLI3_9BACT|nr:hypothetical protein LF1_31890 [Rubripirellula obstinata]
MDSPVSRPTSIPRHLNFRVAELAKSFGYEGDAESLRDFRYLLTED